MPAARLTMTVARPNLEMRNKPNDGQTAYVTVTASTMHARLALRTPNWRGYEDFLP